MTVFLDWLALDSFDGRPAGLKRGHIGSLLDASSADIALSQEKQGGIIVNIISGREKIPQATEKSSPLRVLVVDDEPLIRWSLVQTLNDSGHETAEARDAASAIVAVRESPRPFDVALLDLRLPDSTGLDLLAAMRRLAPGTQVILMTAYGTPEIVQGAIDMGAFRVVGKPLEMSDMSALVLNASEAGGLI